MQQHVISGWLELRDVDPPGGDEVLYIGEDVSDYWSLDPLVEVIEDTVNLPCTAMIRYFLCNEPVDVEQATAHFINSYYGIVEGEYETHYSEITGYLWTDEELNVGGHDLLTELKQWNGRYLILMIDVEDDNE